MSGSSRMKWIDPFAWTAHRKYVFLLVLDAILASSVLWLSYELRFDAFWASAGKEVWLLVLAPVTSLATLNYLGFYRTVVRYSGVETLRIAALGAVAGAILLATLAWFGRLGLFPRSVFVLYALLLLASLLTVRFAIQETFKRFVVRRGRQLVVYGAGGCGRQFVNGIQVGGGAQVACFVDDDPALWGRVVLGLEVRPPAELALLIAQKGPLDVVLAMPSIQASARKRILDELEQLPVRVSVVSGMDLFQKDNGRKQVIDDLSAEDLLGRPLIQPDQDLMRQGIVDKVVMVTGAGGSIGSELVRQILRVGPKSLIMFENSEFALYRVHQQALALVGEVPIHPVLGDVRHAPSIQAAISRHEVNTIFHAAAYKHVPMVEANVAEACKNNVFGTLNVLAVAIENRVDQFVLVSTDKAVRPTSAMGASKRAAELVVQAYAQLEPVTHCAIVRFGNVLSSSGSVVPLFRAQVKSGGPVTVTHPEITRYFMAAEEAAQLVIQAARLGRSGSIYHLDMGAPVKILELARRVIYWSGHRACLPDAEGGGHDVSGDIAIVYSGLRPGEKLYEELLIDGHCQPTRHQAIFQVDECHVSIGAVAEFLKSLQVAVDRADQENAKSCLSDFVQEYQASSI